jgi:DNA-binding LytR/AlgR family response regulator
LPNNCIRIKHSNTIEKIDFADIKWIQSENVYLEIHTRAKKLVIREQLSKFHEQLPESLFLRVHRSFVVNRSFTNRFDGTAVYIDDNRIPVSKKYKENLDDF